jgi:serine/threonine-protein kinase haspin
MPPLRKYGTKRSTTPAASAAIFGRSPPAAPVPIPVSRPAPRDPLSELSSNLGALVLDKASVSSEPEYTLHPLLGAFQLPPKSWGSVLSSSDTLEKIAEASYAEVFRCANADGTSILKVMQLKVSSDPASLEYTHTSAAETVVSELQIMEALTQVPGFVLFKDVHLIKGNPGAKFKQSWEAYSTLRTSQFPHPDDYTRQSVFLVIELGDAGQVLEDLAMEHLEQVWDILLGIIIALARAEDTNEFEVCSILL